MTTDPTPQELAQTSIADLAYCLRAIALVQKSPASAQVIREAATRLAQLEADAERFQWLAARAYYHSPAWGYHNGHHEIQVIGPAEQDTPKDFREAIDAAMKASAAKPTNSAKGRE